MQTTVFENLNRNRKAFKSIESFPTIYNVGLRKGKVIISSSEVSFDKESNKLLTVKERVYREKTYTPYEIAVREAKRLYKQK